MYKNFISQINTNNQIFSKKLIIVKLKGGLGNQLFQYALARNIAYSYNIPFKLDISGFENSTHMKYALCHYNTIENFTTGSDMRKIIHNTGKLKNIINKLKKTIYPYTFLVVNEKNFCYDPNILKTQNNVYLNGYWQSEKYFINIRNILIKEFTVKEKPDAKNRAIADEISTKNAVSLHVRRGDYITNPGAKQVIGTCSIEYYTKAIKLIKEKTVSPHFFIFSDDPEWAKENIKTGCPTTYISHNGPEKCHEDLNLMSKCKHNVIANSTFSWWGAWLNQNKNKIVISPKRWFNDTSINKGDLVPDSWLKL